MLPDFPKAKKVIMDELMDFFEKQISFHSQGLVASIKSRAIPEGDGLYVQYTKDFSHESEMRPIHSSFEINTDEIIGDPFSVLSKLDEAAKEAAYQKTSLVFDSISQVTEKAGNVLTTHGQMRPEDILNIFEKIEIDFNEDGTARMPGLHAGEKMIADAIEAFKEIDTNPELRKRFNGIMQKQKENWNDRENNRKLVG